MLHSLLVAALAACRNVTVPGDGSSTSVAVLATGVAACHRKPEFSPSGQAFVVEALPGAVQVTRADAAGGWAGDVVACCLLHESRLDSAAADASIGSTGSSSTGAAENALDGSSSTVWTSTDSAPALLVTLPFARRLARYAATGSLSGVTLTVSGRASPMDPWTVLGSSAGGPGYAEAAVQSVMEVKQVRVVLSAAAAVSDVSLFALPWSSPLRVASASFGPLQEGILRPPGNATADCTTSAPGQPLWVVLDTPAAVSAVWVVGRGDACCLFESTAVVRVGRRSPPSVADTLCSASRTFDFSGGGWVEGRCDADVPRGSVVSFWPGDPGGSVAVCGVRVFGIGEYTAAATVSAVLSRPGGGNASAAIDGETAAGVYASSDDADATLPCAGLCAGLPATCGRTDGLGSGDSFVDARGDRSEWDPSVSADFNASFLAVRLAAAVRVAGVRFAGRSDACCQDESTDLTVRVGSGDSPHPTDPVCATGATSWGEWTTVMCDGGPIDGVVVSVWRTGGPLTVCEIEVLPRYDVSGCITEKEPSCAPHVSYLPRETSAGANFTLKVQCGDVQQYDRVFFTLRPGDCSPEHAALAPDAGAAVLDSSLQADAALPEPGRYQVCVLRAHTCGNDTDTVPLSPLFSVHAAQAVSARVIPKPGVCVCRADTTAVAPRSSLRWPSGLTAASREECCGVCHSTEDCVAAVFNDVTSLCSPLRYTGGTVAAEGRSLCADRGSTDHFTPRTEHAGWGTQVLATFAKVGLHACRMKCLELPECLSFDLHNLTASCRLWNGTSGVPDASRDLFIRGADEYVAPGLLAFGSGVLAQAAVEAEVEGEWVWCAAEGGWCVCEGDLRYGEGRRWSELPPVAAGGATCSSSTFGDPAAGRTKTCECRPSPPPPRHWAICAHEGGVCVCGTAVRFGSGGRWSTLDTGGRVRCGAAVFGDPFAGATKVCECLSVAVQHLELEVLGYALSPMEQVSLSPSPACTPVHAPQSAAASPDGTAAVAGFVLPSGVYWACFRRFADADWEPFERVAVKPASLTGVASAPTAPEAGQPFAVTLQGLSGIANYSASDCMLALAGTPCGAPGAYGGAGQWAAHAVQQLPEAMLCEFTAVPSGSYHACFGPFSNSSAGTVLVSSAAEAVSARHSVLAPGTTAVALWYPADAGSGSPLVRLDSVAAPFPLSSPPCANASKAVHPAVRSRRWVGRTAVLWQGVAPASRPVCASGGLAAFGLFNESAALPFSVCSEDATWSVAAFGAGSVLCPATLWGANASALVWLYTDRNTCFAAGGEFEPAKRPPRCRLALCGMSDPPFGSTALAPAGHCLSARIGWAGAVLASASEDGRGWCSAGGGVPRGLSYCLYDLCSVDGVGREVVAAGNSSVHVAVFSGAEPTYPAAACAASSEAGGTTTWRFAAAFDTRGPNSAECASLGAHCRATTCDSATRSCRASGAQAEAGRRAVRDCRSLACSDAAVRWDVHRHHASWAVRGDGQAAVLLPSPAAQPSDTVWLTTADPLPAQPQGARFVVAVAGVDAESVVFGLLDSAADWPVDISAGVSAGGLAVLAGDGNHSAASCGTDWRPGSAFELVLDQSVGRVEVVPSAGGASCAINATAGFNTTHVVLALRGSGYAVDGSVTASVGAA